MIRPLFPRTSSAASGFRFCGMIDEPVVNLSDSEMKANCGVVHNTISSAKRDRCTAQIAAVESVSRTKSRSETLSREFAVGRSNSRACAVICRSIGKDVPANAAAPNGHSFARRRASCSRPRSRPIIST